MTSTNGEAKSRTRECKEREAKASRAKDRIDDQGGTSGAGVASTRRSIGGGGKGTPEKAASADNGSPRKTRLRRGGAGGDHSRSSRNGAAKDGGAAGAGKDENGGDGGSGDTSDSDESAVCEDVSVTVAGRKNALRGKVWRARNGDYLRYRCIDDGSEYRPGGKRNSLSFNSNRFGSVRFDSVRFDSI